MNPLGIAAGAGALAAAILFGLWQMERATSAELRGQVDGLKISLETEKGRADAEAKNGERMATMAGDALGLVSGLNERLDAARLTTATHIAQIEALKAKELENAIKEPIARGDAAADRIHSSMCRAVGSTSGACAPAGSPKSDTTDRQE